MTDNSAALAQPTLPLSALVFDPRDNVRSNGAVDDPELEASLVADGVLVPFVVYPSLVDGAYAPSDGGRRLKLLQGLAARGEIPADYPVPVSLRDRPHAEGEAMAVSLAVNLLRAPLHPVDRYEAFAALKAGGLSDKGIALRFGIDERQVRQSLALGRLAPEIRAAWRSGELGDDDEEAAAVAAAFTLAADIEAQRAAFDDLRARHRLDPFQVRRALVPSSPAETRRFLALVGAEAYVAAGGRVVEDLFGDDLYVDDFALLKRLAGERLEAECAALRAAGWAHAETREAVGDNYHRLSALAVPPERLEAAATEEETALGAAAREARAAYQRARELFYDREMSDAETAAEEQKLDALEEAAEAAEEEAAAIARALRRRVLEADPELRGESAAIVNIGPEGRLMVVTGLVKPKTMKSIAADPEAGKRDGAPAAAARSANSGGGFDNKSMELLGLALTRAARDCLLPHPGHALALYLAALDAGAAILEDLSYPALDDDRPSHKRNRPGFLARAEELLACEDKALVAMLGERIARAVDLTWSKFAKTWPREEERALIEAMPREAFVAALAERLDFEAFFKAAGKDAALAAIADCQGPEEALSAAKKKPADLLAYAAARAREKAWLPEPLRFSFYADPATATGWPPKPPKKKPAAKKTERSEASASGRPQAPARSGDSAGGLDAK
jgi:ParB family chromosome partitioning protein